MIAGAWICLLAPLAGALAITLAGQRISRRTAGWISTLDDLRRRSPARSSRSSGCGPRTRTTASRSRPPTRGSRRATSRSASRSSLDPLSSMMMLIVSGVGGLIVWYSMGYMAGDDEERRYFAYMSLFVFSMLMLVQAGNFLLLLVGWGLVGLASYLLIGFWHERPEAVAAAKKAFVMNAIGDATIALALRPAHLGDRHARVLRRLRATSTRSRPRRVNLVALGLLGGAVAKSAQIPLHTWLPGRDGGPDAGLRAHPRGDDGDGRRLPDRPREPDLRGRARRPAPRRDPRRGHAARRRASSRSCSGTSSASSPTRRCRRSATCSSPQGSAPTATRSST